MNIKLLFLIILFARIPLFSQQQARCGVFSSVSNDEGFVERSSQALTKINQYQIKLVFHVIESADTRYITDEAIDTQIKILNESFSGTNQDISDVPVVFRDRTSKLSRITFCLADTNENDQSFSGVVRKTTEREDLGLTTDLYYNHLGGSSSIAPEKYLNVWVVETGEAVTGFGTYPNQVIQERQGAVVHPKYFSLNDSRHYGLGRVLVHEIGHYLGLDHTWENSEGCTLVENAVLDIPPQHGAYSGCPVYPQESCGSSDLFMNFMDYVDDPCMVMFTKGQVDKMISTLASDRTGLVENSSCHTNHGKENGFVLFPNPSTGWFQLAYNNADKPGPTLRNCVLFDGKGSILSKEKRLIYNGVSFDFSYLPPGVYFLRVGEINRKIVLM